MKTLILAGGFATRLWPITEKRAKPLLYLAGKEIISHLVEKIPEEIEIIISTNKIFEEDFLKWRKKYKNKKIKIFIEDSFSDNTKKGALGATSLVIEKEKISEDLLLLAGDNFFNFKLKDFLKKFKENPLLACYDIGEKEKAKAFGVVVTEDGKTVKNFQEKPLEPLSTLVSTGCFLFPKKDLKEIQIYAKEKSDDLGGVFEYLKSKGREINLFSFSEEWFDIGSFQGYLNAHKLLQEKNFIGKNTIFQKVSRKKSKNFIGDNCTVTNSNLENCLIMENVKIENCELRDCIVDKNSTLKNLHLVHKLIREESFLVA